MKKKYHESDEENEFDVDEPEEIQNNATDDEWTPDKDMSSGRRTSTRLRNIPKSRAPIIDASSTDEENSDDSGNSKRKGKSRGRGRQIFKKQKVSSTTTNTNTTTIATSSVVKLEQPENNGKSVNSDCEPSSTTTTSANNSPVCASPTSVKVSKEFTSGAFVVLKTDAANVDADPPLWKIDGKALLQKYIPFQEDGKTYYRNTSVYSGWTLNNKDNYYPITVLFKQQTRKEHIVEFPRNQLKLCCSENYSPDSSAISSTTEQSDQKPPIQKEISPEPVAPVEKPHVPIERPVIKVKSFATIVHEDITPSKTLPNTIVNKPTSSELPQVTRPNTDYLPGSFLVLRTDAANVDPPIWKIDGKALLQKYTAFFLNGKTLYKNTAEYAGWCATSKTIYFPVSVIFVHQSKKDHIVELDRIKWNEPDEIRL